MGRRSDMTNKSILIALVISLIIWIIWTAIEFIQFGEIQNNRICDDVVFKLYYIILAIAFSKW